MKFVDWEADSSRSGDGGQFLKLKGGNKYRVRLVGKAVGYLQHWDPVICRSPGKDDKGNIIDPLMIDGHEPKKRYAIWVINRDDGNKLQIMDFPPTLFDQFKAWKSACNEEPGGSKGCDWQIRLEIPSNGDKRRTKYLAMPLDRTPFTEEEIALMRQIDIKKVLTEVRRDNTPEEIRKMMADKANKGSSSGGSSEEIESEPIGDATSVATAKAPAPAPAQQPKKFDPKKDDPIQF